MSDTWLIVGLGNPGRRYAATRHNIGQLVIDELVARAGATLGSTKANAVAAVTRMPGSSDVPGAKAVVMKSLSYMNESGLPVRRLADFYSVPPERVVAIHDDVDLPFETIRLKQGGGEGGHNGLRSITSHLGTKNYLRVRAGIGRPPGRMDTADYVLQKFSKAELSTLPIFTGELADAVEMLTAQGLAETQQKFHAKG